MTDRCSICPARYRPVPGDGPQPAHVLMIGERPGSMENQRGVPFVGPSGRELNSLYLPTAGLDRADVRVCNAVACWAEEDRTPTQHELVHCARHFLPGEIALTDPEYIFLLGGTVCKLIPGLSLEMTHGIPQLASLYDWSGIVIPMFHPALGLHEGRWMTQMIEDWDLIVDRLDAIKKDIRPDPRPPVTYRAAITGQEVTEWLGDAKELSCDTEDHAGVPWSVQISRQPADARLIRADNREAIEALILWSERHPAASWSFHHAIHDLAVCRQLGFTPRTYRDTLREAFHLANLPLGLKLLVFRLFAHKMTSWEDVVRPASIEALLAWACEALDVARADLSLLDVTRLKTKVREIRKKGPVESLLDRIIRCTHDESNYDPWRRLDEYWADPATEWMTSHIEARVGRYPVLGIANAPFERALTYACSDADWTLETARELARRRDPRLWRTDPGDKDQ